MRIGVDVGSVRVGVATSDPMGLLAVPWRTLARDLDQGADLTALVALAAQIGAIELVVGLPRQLNGTEGAAALAARAYAEQLVERLAARAEPGTTQPRVALVDERLTTVQAHRTLRESGRAGRSHRAVVDQAAAVLILQSALDAEAATGSPPGAVVGSTVADETGVPKPRKTRRARA